MTTPSFANRTIWTGYNLDILQLLRPYCNRIKSDRTRECFIARLLDNPGQSAYA